MYHEMERVGEFFTPPPVATGEFFTPPPVATGEYFAYPALGQETPMMLPLTGKEKLFWAAAGGGIIALSLWADMKRKKTTKWTPLWIGGMAGLLIYIRPSLTTNP